MSVTPVRSPAELRAFIGFPYRHYRRDPLWAPPLRRDVAALLSRTKNPFFRHADAEYLLARGTDGRIAGRIAAISNEAHNRFHEDRVGFFGFFESVDEQAVADALLGAAAEWLRARGLNVVRGPASLSTNDECGLLVDGFDTPPALLMPHNPPYYARLLERAGFVKAMDLLAYQSTGQHLPQHLMDVSRRLASRRKITLRSLDMRRFDAELELVKTLYNDAWEKNWGFVPMTDEEMNRLARQLKPVIVPELVVFAVSEGRPIGFAIALPDLNVALRRNRSGRLFPFGLFRILWHARRTDRVRVVTLGVLREFRLSGADALMYEWIWTHGRARGYRWAESSWVLETNLPMRNALERVTFEVYKTYRMYDRPL